jgi:hypothetical protein
MPLERKLQTRGLSLTDVDEQRIRHHLDALERRLVHHPEPVAGLVLAGHPMQRQVEAHLRVRLTPLGAHLVSHQAAATTDQAVRLAVEDVERELERKHAEQRGEPSFGVPSRRPWRRRNVPPPEGCTR